jgi:integrase
MRRNQLEFFRNELKLSRIAELRGRLAEVEALMRRLRTAGRSPRTVVSYGESLSAFCAWCVERKFLNENEYSKLRKGLRSAVRKRRAFTPDELRAVLEVANPARKLLYLVAVVTGYRAKELKALRVCDFDAERFSLRLSGELTKNRRNAEQPLPLFVVEILRRLCGDRASNEKLLGVPSHTARELEADMVRAGVAKRTDEGVLDFHSLRVTYVTWLAESGAHPGEVQELARHASPDLTFGVYSRSGLQRKRTAVEQLSGLLSAIGAPFVGEKAKAEIQ